MIYKMQYKLADKQTQARLLAQYPILDRSLKSALKSMSNRVDRFYGLNNKYDGKGNLRK